MMVKTTHASLRRHHYRQADA